MLRSSLATGPDQQSDSVDTSKAANNQQPSHEADTASIHNPAATDSRIINIGLLNEHLKEIAAHAATCQSYQSKVESLSLDDTMLIGEAAHHGMASILAYKCSGCGENISFATSSKVDILSNGKYWTCNVAAVWGQMATGGGFNHLEEPMSILGVPVMSKQSFITTEKQLENSSGIYLMIQC